MQTLLTSKATTTTILYAKNRIAYDHFAAVSFHYYGLQSINYFAHTYSANSDDDDDLKY